MSRMVPCLRQLTQLICLMTLFVTGASWADYRFNYKTIDEIETLLLELESRATTKSKKAYRLYTLGYTYEGRPLRAVKFSDNPEIEEAHEPVLIIDGGIHPREVLSSESSANYIEYLFKAYHTPKHPDHAEVTGLIEDLQIWIIPSMNPDGLAKNFEQSDGDPGEFFESSKYSKGWRINRQPLNCPGVSGGKVPGGNLNRTFSVNFKFSDDCSNQFGNEYGGKDPFELHESRLIKQFVLNRAATYILHQHSPLQITATYAGGYSQHFTNELQRIWHDDLPSPLWETQTPTRDEEDFLRPNGESPFPPPGFGGQYPFWLWFETSDSRAPDQGGRRLVPSTLFEFPSTPSAYGPVASDLYGQHKSYDGSNNYHPSSGDAVQFARAKSVQMYNYLARQARYIYSPRRHADMSRKPGPSVEDLAIIGATIGPAELGRSGGFYYRDQDARDMLTGGLNRIRWNVQNNGKKTRSASAEVWVCNQDANPNCRLPYRRTLQADMSPLAITTFQHDFIFQPNTNYKVYVRTGEQAYGNDEKIFVFTTGQSTRFHNCTKSSVKAGTGLGLKFSIRTSDSNKGGFEFVAWNDLEIRIYEKDRPGTLLQSSTYGPRQGDYAFSYGTGNTACTQGIYTTWFVTDSTPGTYVAEVWKPAGNRFIDKIEVTAD